jgi:hypothetical protein
MFAHHICRVAKPGGYTSVSGGFNKFWGGNGQNSCAAGLALTGFLGTEAQVSLLQLSLGQQCLSLRLRPLRCRT